MGNLHSTVSPKEASVDQVYHTLTRRLEAKFDTHEIKAIRETFHQLATPVSDLDIWTEDTFVKFLELPDDVGSLLFLSASYIASFPFTDESPAILTYDALLRTIAIMCGRIDKVVKSSARLHLIYNSFAVHENIPTAEKKHETIASDKEDAIDYLDKLELFTFAEAHTSTKGLRVRKPDLKSLLKFLLSLQEMKDTEVVSNHIERFSSENSNSMSIITQSIVDSISKDDRISFEEIRNFMEHSPSLLSALPSLYAHFLYPSSTSSTQAPRPERAFTASNLLNDNSAAQLSTFLPVDLVFGKADALYRASHDGFSMGSFETKVLKYPGPTLLLIDGTINGAGPGKFGLFSNVPWKQSSKDCFGDSKTTFFQLKPFHRVFKSPQLMHGAWFSKPMGLGVGCLPPTPHKSSPDYGNLSLVVDTSLEYATFRDETAADNFFQKLEIREVEVWGLGGDREAQRKAWEWEEREAIRRRTVNVKEMKADYDLLEMAGLVGQNRSGGSV